MIGIELVVPGTKTPNVAYTLRILEKARELGLLIGRGGLLGNVLRITPPMSVTQDECVAALSVLHETFAQTAP